MKTPNKLITITLLSFLLAGCASIFSDSSYPVAVTSTPSGANFEITDQTGHKIHSGTTPTSVMLEASTGYFSKANYTIKFKKPGYTNTSVTLNPTIDGWYFANILGGFIGAPIGFLVIDPLTGSMYKLPRNISSTLHANNTSSSPDNNHLTIVSINDLSDQQKRSLIPVGSN